MSTEASHVVTGKEETYEVAVKGRRQPTPVAVTIENVGDTPVVNPRLTVNGRYDWYSREAMAAELTRGCDTDEEKAFALWRHFRETRYQMGNGDETTLHPVRYLCVYGYGICGHTAAAFVSLCQAAGLKARVYEIWHHTVSEVFYDGAWHMLDANVKAFYPTWDNRSVASMEQLEQDPGLVRRCYPPGKNPRIMIAQWYATSDDNFIQHGYDREAFQDYTLGITLRPGERLVRSWKSVGKFYGMGRRRTPSLSANGQLVYAPQLASPGFLQGISANRQNPFNMTAVATDGQKPNLHVLRKHDSVYDCPSHWWVDVTSPYVIVGGRLRAKVHKGGNSRYDALSLGLSVRRGGDGKPIWEAEGTGDFALDMNLDEHLQREGLPPVYRYSLRFQAFAARGAAQPVQTGVDELELTSDIQVAPKSLPALGLGANLVHYWDESPDGRRVRITFLYDEHDDSASPAPPALREPADGRTVADLAPKLAWDPARHPDGPQVSDYYIQVSPNLKCIWPISANFEGSLGPATEFRTPEGWLLPGKTYYWRVKASGADGLWGDWSSIHSFCTPGA